MLKFNNTNIFTGYIKQLLASFNLPKYRIYTKEQEDYHTNYLIQYTQNSKDLADLELEITDWKNSGVDETSAGYKSLITRRDALKAALMPEKDIIVSMYRKKTIAYTDREKEDISEYYPKHMRYVPYIRHNEIQIYAPTIKTEIKTQNIDGIESEEIVDTFRYSESDWKPYHGAFEAGHEKLHGNDDRFVSRGYTYGLKIKNGTKNLKITNNSYDTYTHEYLGDYLRFHRDYCNINLMPLYNCFSNRVCPNLDVSFNVSDNYTATFKTDDKKYKIYIVPIKFFQKYTIAIDCNDAVEMCCGLYGHYAYKATYNEIMQSTYMCFNNLKFDLPVLIEPTNKLMPYLDPNHSLELAQHEDDLKLFIKLPASNTSSIAILEGNYADYANPCWGGKYYYTGLTRNNTKTDEVNKNLNILKEVITSKTGFNDITTDDQQNALILEPIVTKDSRYIFGNVASTNDETESISWTKSFIYNGDPGLKNYAKNDLLYSQNKTIINFETEKAFNNRLITPLQLLSLNTGISYPFADRLIEYLVGNVITPLDSIGDNVLRVKTAATKHLKYATGIVADELWDDKLKIYFYNYIINNKKLKNKNHDILGYVDKDIENNYSYINKWIKYKNGHELAEEDWKKEIKTLSCTNIYDDKEWED